jgi:ABC-type cobalamin/Fe3+-siderophores transport system ATPase subunit
MENIRRILRDTISKKWHNDKILVVIGSGKTGKTALIKSICEQEPKYVFINGEDSKNKLELENTGESKLQGIIGTHKTVFF